MSGRMVAESIIEDHHKWVERGRQAARKVADSLDARGVEFLTVFPRTPELVTVRYTFNPTLEIDGIPDGDDHP